MTKFQSVAATRKVELAAEIAERTSRIAHADSRFGRDFSQFIPNFDGAASAAHRVLAIPECQTAKRVFITPDNAVAAVRQLLIQAGVDLVMPSYGLHRGFIEVSAASIPSTAVPHAGWLDSIEHYGRSLTLDELRLGNAMDLIITGSSAITLQGLRFGMGDFYLDIEWAILRNLELVDEKALVIAVVHDDQITELKLDHLSSNVVANLIVTPTRTIEGSSRDGLGRPRALDWSIVPAALMQTATLQDFRNRLNGAADHPSH